MAMARTIARRSRCSRDQVGAVIVDTGNRIVDAGYNGPPAGFVLPSNIVGCRTWCDRAGRMHAQGGEYDPSPCYDDCYSLHAEANVLMRSDRKLREGGTIYVSSPVCFNCAKLIANSGLYTCVALAAKARHQHRDPDRSYEFMDRCGITVVTV
jgi:dCMP deaminase